MTYDQVMDATVRLSQHSSMPISMIYWKLILHTKPLLAEWILIYRCEQLRGNSHDVYWESRLDPDLVAEISRKWIEEDPMEWTKVAKMCWRWRKNPELWWTKFGLAEEPQHEL